MTVVLSAMALASAALIASGINNAGIPLSNALLSSLLGSDTFAIHLSFPVILMAVLLALFLGILASWFPALMALRIQPARAVAQE